MRVLTVQGNHYEMGFQHGCQVLDIRPLIIEAIERRLAALDGKAIASLLDELGMVWEVEGRTTLEVLAGMATALNLEEAHLFKYSVASYLEDSLRAISGVEGCTVWAAAGPATVDGTPILTKNRDYSLAHLELQALALATPQRGYRYLYVTSAASPGVFSSGMNEQGLVVADTHVLSSDLGPGLARYSLMMELLERCESVVSALDYLVKAPRMGGGNLVLLDATGDMAVFETGYRRWGIVPGRNHIVVATNHFVTDNMRECYLQSPNVQMDDESEPRQRYVLARLNECWGSLDTKQAAKIMAWHGDEGPAICRHSLRSDAGTISNAIFLPAERGLLYCDGRPCESTYTHHSL